MWKQVIAAGLCALLLPISAAALEAESEAAAAPEENFMEQMLLAVTQGDAAAGAAAEAQRAEKIAAQALDYVPVNYEELELLAKIIQAEAGSAWLDEDWKMAVGEVVLNRVASPEFPNTLREVIEQQGQYYGRNSSFLKRLKPSYESAAAAMKLLEGQRVLNEPSVVFQANGRQGSGVFLELRDKALGSTYLCYSSHRELYPV